MQLAQLQTVKDGLDIAHDSLKDEHVQVKTEHGFLTGQVEV